MIMQKRNGAPDEDGAPGNNNHAALYASSGDRATKRLKRSASKSPLRRSIKRKRVSTKSCAREVALYDGQILVAIIRVSGNGKCIAFDADDKRLGSYPTLQAATNALHAARGGGG
jgi:hypothetical protein